MAEDELLKKLKKKMAICTILQRKFGCKCAKTFREGIAETTYQPFCEAVVELYKELKNDCLNCELYKEAHEVKEWEH